MAVRTIDYLQRLTCSVNGNPRFRVHFTDGSSALTQSDASVAYGLGNPEYRDVPLEVTFTKAGRIAYLKVIEKGEVR
jgi:hypothetical protein